MSNKELTDTTTLELVGTADDEYLYHAKYTLPLGYMVSSTINDDWNYKNSNPFSVQNDFVQENTGISSLFTTIDFNNNDKGGITIDVEKDEHVYVYIGNKSVKTAKVTIDESNENFAGINHGRIIDLGWQTAGTLIKIADKDGEEALNAYVYTMNADKFIEAYNILNTQGLDVTAYSDTKISGTIHVNEAGILMLSIPYDPSWTLKVNGVKTEITEIAEALIGVELEPGDYTIELSFTPRGFKPGIMITFTSVVILFIIYCFYRKEAGKGFLPFTKAKGIQDNSSESTAKAASDSDSSISCTNAVANDNSIADNNAVTDNGSAAGNDVSPDYTSSDITDKKI